MEFFMKPKIILCALLCALFEACTLDLGYDPSDKYDDIPIQYTTYSYNNLPDCTDDIEGTVFYVSGTETVYACIEEFWTSRPDRKTSSDELQNAEPYDRETFGQKKSSNNRSSSSRYSSSSSYNDDWYYDDDDWYYDDDNWNDNNRYDDEYNQDPYGQKSSSSSIAISSSSSLSSSNENSNNEDSNTETKNPFESGDYTISTIETWLADTAAVEAWLEEAHMTNSNLDGDFDFKTALTYKKDEATISFCPAIDIGNQRWTVTNVNTFKKGIASITGLATSSCSEQEPCVYYENTDDDLCPYGYHIPSESEWMELINFTGGTDDAGQHLKATDFSDNPEHIGLNSFGFTAQPLGFIELLNDPDDPTATLTPNVAAFWTRDSSIVYIYSDKDNIEISKPTAGNNYYSIRCVKELQ